LTKFLPLRYSPCGSTTSSPNFDSPRTNRRMHEAAKTFMKFDLPMPVVAKTPM